jgi:hypothetical protein
VGDTRQRIADLATDGYCLLPLHFAPPLIDACRAAVWRSLLTRVEGHEANRGERRHFFPMPFETPSFAPESFFDDTLAGPVRNALTIEQQAVMRFPIASS